MMQIITQIYNLWISGLFPKSSGTEVVKFSGMTFDMIYSYLKKGCLGQYLANLTQPVGNPLSASQHGLHPLILCVVHFCKISNCSIASCDRYFRSGEFGAV